MIVCYSFALGLEVLAAIALMQNRPGTFVLFHALSVALFLMATLLAVKKNKTTINLHTFLFALWASLPILGALATVLSITLMSQRVHQRGSAIQTVMDNIEQEEELLREYSRLLIYGKEGSERETHVDTEPLGDLLRSDDFETKKKVISQFRHSGTREAIHLLKTAQADSDYDVQYLSTAALSSIEQEWHDEIKNLGHEISLAPKDIRLRNEIVSSYMRIFGSNLFPETVERIHFAQALEHVTVSLAVRRNDPDMLVQLGKIKLALGKYQEAKEAFSSALGLRPEVSAYRFWRAEASYFLHDYDTLREDCKILSEREDLHPKLLPVVQFWGADDKSV